MKIRNVYPQLYDVFQALGFTPSETDLYLILLKVGPISVLNLAKECGLKRSTTHNKVEELIKKGLVSQSNNGERRVLIAEKPEKLIALIEHKRWQLDKIAKSIPHTIDLLNSLVDL